MVDRLRSRRSDRPSGPPPRTAELLRATSRTSRRQAGAARGFTLVELLLVLTVTAILSGILAASVDVSGYRMRGAVQEVGTALLATQRLAVKRQHNVVVAFDVPGRVMRVHEDADNDGDRDEGEIVRNIPLAEGVVFGRGAAPAWRIGQDAVSFVGRQDGLPAVTFHRDGSVDAEGGFYLTSREAERTGRRASDARAVEIERSTGRATWFRYVPPEWKEVF